MSPSNYSRASVLKLYLFQKAVWEAICLKTKLQVTDHTGIIMKRWWSRSEVLSRNWDIFFFCEQLGPELNCLRWETFENWGLTVTDNPCFSRFSPYLDTCITHHWQGNQILFGSKFGAKSTRLRKSVVGKLWMWNSCFFPRDQSFTWVSMKSV